MGNHGGKLNRTSAESEVECEERRITLANFMRQSCSADFCNTFIHGNDKMLCVVSCLLFIYLDIKYVEVSAK